MKWQDLNIKIHNDHKSEEAFDLLCRLLNDKKDIRLVRQLKDELEARFYEPE